MLKTVVALPVLLALFLGVYDVGLLLTYKVQTRSAATAAALAAVGTQEHYPIPIPTKFVWAGFPIPVDGYIINTLHLPNVDATLRSWTTGQVRNESESVAKLTNPDIRLQSRVLPTGWVPLPFKWVEVTAEVDPPRGVFSRIAVRQPLRHKACAVAWVRPDYWVHPWWDKRTLEVTDAFLEKLGPTEPAGSEEPLRYYRQVTCGISGVPELLEVIAEAHFQATGRRPSVDEMKRVIDREELRESGEAVQRWKNGERSPRKSREELVRCIESPDDCVELPPAQIRCPGSDVTIERPAPVVYTRETPPESRPMWTEADLIREKCP
ncbi:MAG TPA: hypothetical protein VIL07_01645 [Symbiobacteriaceae bacterium]